jgi:hypothetical protein
MANRLLIALVLGLAVASNAAIYNTPFVMAGRVGRAAADQSEQVGCE